MSTYDEIAACAAAYAAARDELTATASDLADHVGVLRARVALVECLLRAGWTAPQETQDLLKLDRQLLSEPTGSSEALFASDDSSRP